MPVPFLFSDIGRIIAKTLEQLRTLIVISLYNKKLAIIKTML